MDLKNSVYISAAFIPVNRKLLVVQRNEKGQEPLKWELPGGKLNDGELFDQALVREIQEELGIHVEAVEEVGSVEIDEPDRVLIIMFILAKGDVSQIQLKEHNAIRYVTFDELKKLDLLKADMDFVLNYENVIKKHID